MPNVELQAHVRGGSSVTASLRVWDQLSTTLLLNVAAALADALEARRRQAPRATVTLTDWSAIAENVGRCRFPACRGRPRGSALFSGAEDFIATVGAAVAQVRQQRAYPSQRRVLAHLRRSHGDIDRRQLSRWCRRYGFLTWKDFLNEVDRP